MHQGLTQEFVYIKMETKYDEQSYTHVINGDKNRDTPKLSRICIQ